VLMFIGVKMLLSRIYPIPIGLSLAIVAGILAGSVVLSLLCPPKKAGESKK
jgi:tellurite resistance protein TerC